MSVKENISIRKLGRIAFGAALFLVFSVALIAASTRQRTQKLIGFSVQLNEESEFSFLQKKDIEQWLLKNRNIRLDSLRRDQLNLKKMEQIAETNPWVAQAEMYVDNRGILQMEIRQREPVARIFSPAGASFYMDSSLHEMPISLGYAYPAPVFTNVTLLRNDSMRTALKMKMAYLSRVIQGDSFWNAQIAQIEVQPDETFVLIPLLGDQRIIFGDTAHAVEKLANLFAFYKNVMPKIGWEAYETLDLRFDNQIVAAPTLNKTLPKITKPPPIERLSPPHDRDSARQ